ncbi:hypothetical protein N0V93_000867 [Gnomoniopsis smithogilvyi]|uniref:Zn(2)-C6 fungal-type domain-containing protein n=1 Tax=Gnomoniopsis smithogilvyi TaxID=1191159 RepID=A0A9W8Z2G7_9PEZI|nr:hypothetical protein N0V93_000867 [Gnomoniopsis smithogilvyi]
METPRVGEIRCSLSQLDPVQVRLGDTRLRKRLEILMNLRASAGRGRTEYCFEQSDRQQSWSNPVDKMEPTTPIQQPRKRPRLPGGRTACTRCKTRKQKCDDEWPKCTNCQKAAVECDKAYDDSSPSYTKSLEDKIEALQNRLLEQEQAIQQFNQSTPHNERRSSHNALGEVVEALSQGNFEAPAYIGSSSGFSLALNLGSMVQASIWNEALPSGARPESKGNVGSPASLDMTARNITMEEIIAHSAEPPDDEYGRKLLEAYCAQLHPRYPFLDIRALWTLHSERLVWRARSIGSLSMTERFGIFKLYLVYAIGAMLLNLTEKKSRTSPESFYMAALQHIHAARESRTVQNIEAMTLLVSLDYGHSFIAVQTVFVAGITLLHGIWTQGHIVWSVPLSNDVRACSLVLFAMTERAPWVAKYRDAFEILVDASMEKLQSGETKLCETAAAQVQNRQIPDTEANGSAGTWRVVEELATWIDQGQGTPLWMPAFDNLQYL